MSRRHRVKAGGSGLLNRIAHPQDSRRKAEEEGEPWASAQPRRGLHTARQQTLLLLGAHLPAVKTMPTSSHHRHQDSGNLQMASLLPRGRAHSDLSPAAQVQLKVLHWLLLSTSDLTRLPRENLILYTVLGKWKLKSQH